MRTVTIGVDLSKQVFSVCSVDAAGRVHDRRELRRDAFRQWLAQVAPGTTVAMASASLRSFLAVRLLRNGLTN